MSSEWKQVGEIDVDAGLCWIGDPCYCVTPDADNHPAQTWSKFCDRLRSEQQNGALQWNFPGGHAGLGVTVSTGAGDGTYPVLVRYDGDHVAEVRVVFLEPQSSEGAEGREEG